MNKKLLMAVVCICITVIFSGCNQEDSSQNEGSGQISEPMLENVGKACTLRFKNDTLGNTSKVNGVKGDSRSCLSGFFVNVTNQWYVISIPGDKIEYYVPRDEIMWVKFNK